MPERVGRSARTGGNVLKRLALGILAFAAGVAGNLLAAAIQQDAWQNLFTPARLIATVVGAAVMLVVLAALESERGLAWNWPWHRFWYLRGLAANPQIRQWEHDFARLNLAQGKRPFTTTEVIAAGERRDMVRLLYDAFLQKGNHGRRMLVLGEPGAGKTTGLERLTLELSRQKAWRLGIGRPIPILLRLGNYQAGDLITFVAAEMGRAVGGQSGVILGKELETLLAKGRVLLLCDALDEALGEQRNLVLAELDRFLRSPRYARVGVVITARTREDPGGRLPDLPVYTIQDLHDEAVKAFVRVYHPPGVEEGEIIGRLTKAGLLEPGGLGRNPFWLRIVVESGVFQGEKGKILDQAVNTLLQREWDKPEAGRSGWRRIKDLTPAEQIEASRKGLARLAYRMSVAGVVAVAEQQGNTWVGDGLKQENSPEQLRAAHVVGLGRDAQLLTYLSDKLRFRHRLLQEALTAWLLAGNEALGAEVINRYADDTAWWETLLMLAHLVDEPEKLIETVLPGGSEQRLFLAAGMLQGVERPSAALRRQVMDALSQSMSQGITEGHKAAVIALAQIVQDDVVALLTGLLLDSDAHLQNGIAQLLAELGDDAVQAALSTLGQSISQVITEGYKTAVIALAQIARDDVVALLRELFLAGETSRQSDILALLVSLGGDAVENIFSDWGLPPLRRAEIGRTLAQMGDPRPGVGVVERDGMKLPDIAWGEWVAAGTTYEVGGDKQAYRSLDKQKVTIPHDFRLSRYPITYAQFQCFIEAPDVADARWWAGMPADAQEWREQRFPIANHPREMVTWYQALAFCRWLSDKLGQTITLPHEYEWEIAARWPDGRFYPWGNEFDSAKANTDEGKIGQTTAVGLYPSGRNVALNLDDLSGNVWEWCRNRNENPDSDMDPNRVDMGRASRVLRGGSWYLIAGFARAACRGSDVPGGRDRGLGFRVVVVVRPPSHRPGH